MSDKKIADLAMNRLELALLEQIRKHPRIVASTLLTLVRPIIGYPRNLWGGDNGSRVLDRALQRLRKAGHIKNVPATKTLPRGWKVCNSQAN